MSVSPQGYNLGGEPRNENPFWGEGEDQDVNRIFMDVSITGGHGTPSASITKNISGHDILFSLLLKNLVGAPGEDGYSPSVTITNITGGHRITITDKTSTHTFDVMDGTPGTPGAPGTPGTNGISPDVTVTNITGGHRVTITDATGSESFDVMDGTPGEKGDTPVITITATQDGEPVPVTKTGTDAAPNFNIALTGGGGGASGTIGWGTEVASTDNYPAIKHVKSITSESRSEKGKQINGQLNDDQYNWIYISGSCDVSIDNNTQASDDASVKMAEEDTNSQLSWRSASGFVIDNLVITDNSSMWTFSNIQVKPEFVGASSTFIDSMTFKITCTATDGTATKTVSGNASITFDKAIPYTTVTTYQNLEVIPEA